MTGRRARMAHLGQGPRPDTHSHTHCLRCPAPPCLTRASAPWAATRPPTRPARAPWCGKTQPDVPTRCARAPTLCERLFNVDGAAHAVLRGSQRQVHHGDLLRAHRQLLALLHPLADLRRSRSGMHPRPTHQLIDYCVLSPAVVCVGVVPACVCAHALACSWAQHLQEHACMRHPYDACSHAGLQVCVAACHQCSAVQHLLHAAVPAWHADQCRLASAGKHGCCRLTLHACPPLPRCLACSQCFKLHAPPTLLPPPPVNRLQSTVSSRPRLAGAPPTPAITSRPPAPWWPACMPGLSDASDHCTIHSMPGNTRKHRSGTSKLLLTVSSARRHWAGLALHTPTPNTHLLAHELGICGVAVEGVPGHNLRRQQQRQRHWWWCGAGGIRSSAAERRQAHPDIMRCVAWHVSGACRGNRSRTRKGEGRAGGTLSAAFARVRQGGAKRGVHGGTAVVAASCMRGCREHAHHPEWPDGSAFQLMHACCLHHACAHHIGACG